ncbi:MAG: DUF4270 domain-containing protein [Bacteroidales bacterium]|nr:DUF4270 domain-containing protein [Bacteroidales bacterium]
MPNTFKRLLKLTGAVVLTGLLTWSCENDPATIGLEALPSSDVLDANSTENALYGSNFVPDRIVSDNNSLNKFPYGIIGYFNDPLFGWTKADIVTEVTLSASLPDFRYDPNTGDADAKHTIQVYELSQRLDTASSANRYFSNYEILGNYYSNLLGEKIFSAADTLSDSTWKAQNYVNVISIPLDKQLSEKLFNLTEDELNNANLLKNQFNGLYITLADPENPDAPGSLIKLDLHNTLSNLTLHYRKEIRELANEDDDEGTLVEVKKLNYIFPINPGARFFNRFTHDHTGKVDLNTTAGNRLKVQGMAGSQAQIDLSPLISQWADSLKSMDPRYSISGVDLIFYADTLDKNANLFTPLNENLLISHLDANNNPIFASAVDDEGKTIPAFKYYSTATYNKDLNTYTFRMNQAYFEKAARGELEVTPFYLTIPYTQFSFKRVVLFNNDSGHPPLFKVRYVKFQE